VISPKHLKSSRIVSNTVVQPSHRALAIKRAFFDKYGEEKLKDGFFSDGSTQRHSLHPTHDSIDFKGGYHFSGKPEEVFEKFFGSSNPFEQICGIITLLSTY
jgi:hypothetical protein